MESTVSPSPRISRYTGTSKQKAEKETQHLFFAIGWPLRNGLGILIDVTPFEEVVKIIVRDSLFIFGDDEASPLSAGGAIKQQSASANALL